MKKLLIISVCCLLCSFISCQQIKDITHKLGNFVNLHYKIESITDFRLSEVLISTKQTLTDFTPVEVLKISNNFAQGKLPVSFIINIGVKNPNNGLNGTNLIPVTLKQLKWRLFIDGIETISGTLKNEHTFPPKNEIVTLPLEVSFDLIQFFGNRGYQGLINLALQLGGVKSDPSIIQLEVEPSLSTPFGIVQAPIVRINNISFN